MSGSEGDRPARGYSWPPFAPGHEKSMKHGAVSERRLRPIVDDLLASLANVAPWTSALAFVPTREAWAWAEARAVLYRRWFDEHGLGEDLEKSPPGLGEWERAEGRAQRLRTELGLSPSSLTKLLRGLSSIDGPGASAGLDALKATAVATRQAADQAALEAARPDDTGDET